jgi:regulator of sigma E protease
MSIMIFLITLLALSVVIFVHELGHLLAAKKSGIAAPEFSIGMGPLLYKKKWGETDYCLRLFPIGGFVKLGGLDESIDSIPDSQNYYHKSFGARFLTIVAGSLMNIFLGWILYTAVFIGLGKPVPDPSIASVLKNSPAAAVGLMPGDRLISIEGDTIVNPATDFGARIKADPDHTFTVVIERNGDKKTVLVKPVLVKGAAQIGITFGQKIQPLSVLESISEALFETFRQVKGVFVSLDMLFTGKAGLKDLAGPVGILQFASVGLEKGFLSFLSVIAMISISLGVANLLPIPVLDGGHVVFLCIEKIIGKRLPQKVEVILTNIGAALLIALMVFIVGSDVMQWEARTSILKGFK